MQEGKETCQGSEESIHVQVDDFRGPDLLRWCRQSVCGAKHVCPLFEQLLYAVQIASCFWGFGGLDILRFLDDGVVERVINIGLGADIANFEDSSAK